MKIAILGNAGSWYGDDIERAACERKHDAQRVDFQLMTGVSRDGSTSIHSGETDLTRMDSVVVRTMPPGSLEQVVFRMDALMQLQQRGVDVVNSPKSLECAVDKFLTTSRLVTAGIPVPETITCQDSETAMAAFESLGGDIVAKPLFGAEGRGICRISDPDLAFRSFRTLERLDSVLYLQKFIHHAGFDIRILLLDGQVLGAMKRFGDGDFRTNVARSARTEIHDATESEIQLALAAADCVGTRFAGVDLLYDESGKCLVIEVNAVPGWRAFSRTTGIDVADALVRSLERTAHP